jgi:molybdopterin/thiamine biosynthesis adenylyltransferase
MNDDQLLRYSRHLLLEEIDVAGQEKLLRSHVLVIGAGGLGSAATPYLAAAGIGQITLIDPDEVELTNLQRQIMHRQSSIGMLKTESGKAFLQQLNPDIQIHTYAELATASLLSRVLPLVDIVLDCTDNFKARQLINASCHQHQTPLVSGAALRFDGQISVFNSGKPQSPCYACVFSPNEMFEETQCATMGVFSPLVGIIGSIQAAQALQVLLGFGESLIGKLMLWNAKTNQVDMIQLKRNPNCPVCQNH